MNEQRPGISPQGHPTIKPQVPHPVHPQQPPVAQRAQTGVLPKVGALPTQHVKLDDHELDPVSLVDEIEGAEPSDEKKIKAFGVLGGAKQRDWKRKVHANGTGAGRVRTFHGKLSDQGMQFIDDAINEWLENHPEIEVKFVTSSVGQFDGKIREPALVLNLWY